MATGADKTLIRQQARQRELLAWSLRQESLSERDIALRLGVEQQSVNAMLKRVEARIIRQADDIALAVKIRQTKQLEHIQSEAMQAWERSKQAKVKTTMTAGGLTPQTTNKKSSSSKLVKETTERDPNQDFLIVAMDAMKQIRRIWSLDTESAVRGDGFALPQVQNIQINMNSGGFVVANGPAAPSLSGGADEDFIDAEENDK